MKLMYRGPFISGMWSAAIAQYLTGWPVVFPLGYQLFILAWLIVATVGAWYLYPEGKQDE